MDWNTLFSVALGGLIATIGSILNNRFQAQERQKDRDEQRRETRIQAREKWIEKDILAAMDSLEKVINLHLETVSFDETLTTAESRNESGILKDDELAATIKSLRETHERLQLAAEQSADRITTLVISLGDVEITAAASEFSRATTEYVEKKRQTKEWIEVLMKAGELHKALRNKLISIRDT